MSVRRLSISYPELMASLVARNRLSHVSSASMLHLLSNFSSTLFNSLINHSQYLRRNKAQLTLIQNDSSIHTGGDDARVAPSKPTGLVNTRSQIQSWPNLLEGAKMPPTYLFRAWTDQSYGVNGRDLFAPAAARRASSIAKYTPPKDVPNLKEQLKEHLLDRHNFPDNLFVFFTTSLLFAVQLALYRKALGETGVQIICINADTAKTPKGKKVNFRMVSEMMKECKLQLRNRSDNSLREYADVVAAMECVVPGINARTATLDALIASGLESLYPPFRENRERSDPRLALLVKDLRKYWFRAEIPLTRAVITVAAKVVSAFQAHDSEMEKVSIHILTHLLSFQKRKAGDQALADWLKEFADEMIMIGANLDDDRGREVIFLCEDLPELAQYRQMSALLIDYCVSDDVLQSPGIATSEQMNQEYERYLEFKELDRQEYRDRNPGRGTKRRLDSSDEETQPLRTRRTRSEDMGRRRSERAGGRFRRDRSERLPRYQYRAARDQYRAAREQRRSGVGELSRPE